MTDPKDDRETYFAKKEAKATAHALLDKSRTFFNVMESNQYLEKLRKMWKAYYGAYNNSSGSGHVIEYTGEQGELVALPVNHFANLARHIYVMITTNRPVMEARAVNTDYKSLSQTYLANSILDYYMREKRLEDALKQAAEMAVVLGAGFIKLEWNATAGEAYDVDPETGEFNYEGEIEFTNLTPMDVVTDGTKESWNNEWVLTRSRENRFNLMAKYPEYAEKLKGIAPINQVNNYTLRLFSNDDTDDIFIYEFFHKRTEAMPDGRYLLFVSDDIVLLDTKMPYRDLPVYRISAQDIMGTPYGYSPMFDIFPLQEGINALYSTILTNQNAFGVQNVFVPRNANISINNLEGGLNIIEGDMKPEPLNLTQTPAETFQFLAMLEKTAETISGISSVARGNPEASLKSGNALALVQSMSLQFISGLQQSYVKLIEDVGTSVINILKDFSTAPKVIAMVGKNNRPYLKEFTGESISAINRVVVDVGNPLSRTIAGRVQMAEQLLQMKLLKSPEQYMQIMNTGKLESAMEGEMSELLLIKSENEKMLDGNNPIVSPLDQHRLHIMEHKSVLADPELRNDQQMVKNVLDHVEQHLNMLRTTDPDLLNLIGEQPLAPQGGNPATGNGGAPQPTQGSLSGSPMNDMMASPGAQGNPMPGDQIQTGEQGPQSLPNLPKPPGEFKNMPVTPDQQLPR